MQTQTIEIDKAKAAELYHDYKKHIHYSTPIDHEIRRAYQLIAQGRVIIKALESVAAAGLNEQRLPKLALVRADAATCRFSGRTDGSGMFFDVDAYASVWNSEYQQRENRARVFRFGPGSFPGVEDSRKFQHEAIVPGIPIDKRPKRGLANYQFSGKQNGREKYRLIRCCSVASARAICGWSLRRGI